MKFTKRIFAMGTAMIMAISMMSIGASAYKVEDSWSLRRIKAPGAPTSASCGTITEEYHPAKNGQVFSTFTENCSSFTSSKAENGTKAQVRYWTYIKNKYGETVSIGFSSHYHVETDPYRTFNLARSVSYNDSLVVRYVLENPYDVGCSMNGYYKIN